MLLTAADMQEYAQNLARESVQKGISMADLKRYRLSLPPPENMMLLTASLRPLISSIKRNGRENDKMAALCDTSLPQLVVGQLAVH
jgi:hypothetical protein